MEEVVEERRKKTKKEEGMEGKRRYKRSKLVSKGERNENTSRIVTLILTLA